MFEIEEPRVVSHLDPLQHVQQRYVEQRGPARRVPKGQQRPLATLRQLLVCCRGGTIHIYYLEICYVMLCLAKAAAV